MNIPSKLASLFYLSFAMIISSQVLAKSTTELLLNSAELGLLGQSWQYEEFDGKNATFMKDEGQIYGIIFQPRKQWGEYSWREFVLQITAGEIQYDGFLQNTEEGENIPYQMKTSYTLFDLGAKIGTSWHLNFLDTPMIISPFTGLTSEYIFNHDSPDSPYDYERNINHFLFPLGIELYQAWTSSFGLKFRAQKDIFLSGTVKSAINTGNNTPLENQQTEGGGHQFSLGAHWKTDEQQAVAITLFYRMLEVENSSKYIVRVYDEDKQLLGIKYYMEPKNHTIATGMSISILF